MDKTADSTLECCQQFCPLKHYFQIMQHWNIRVQGKVQGVGYRAFVQQVAQALGVTGFVRNQPDGSVYLEAEGEEPILKILVERCKKGPSQAQVSGVETRMGSVQDFDQFVIQR
jgi:acylphosphatase